MADYEILERDFSESFLKTEGRSFFDGAIHSQIARAFQATFFLANESEFDSSAFLFDFGATPSPDADDVITPDENWNRSIALYLGYMYLTLRQVYIGQPYVIDGLDYYWGRATGDPDIQYIEIPPPEGFYALMPVVATLSFLLGTGPPPDELKYTQNWKAVVDMLLLALEELDLLFSTEINALFEEIERGGSAVGGVGPGFDDSGGSQHFPRALIPIANDVANIAWRRGSGTDFWVGSTGTFVPGEYKPLTFDYGTKSYPWTAETKPTGPAITCWIIGGKTISQYASILTDTQQPEVIWPDFGNVKSIPMKLWDTNGDYVGAMYALSSIDRRAKIKLAVGGSIRFNVNITGLSFTQGICEKITVKIGGTTKTYNMPRDLDSESFTEISSADYNVAISDTFTLSLAAGDHDCSIIGTIEDQYPPESGGIPWSRALTFDLTNGTLYGRAISGCPKFNVTDNVCGSWGGKWTDIEPDLDDVGYTASVFYSPRIEDEIYATLSIVAPE